MIYNGRTGYMSGNMNQPDNTVLASTLGPIIGRNWYSDSPPVYQIVMSPNSTGTVELQGTNDIGLDGQNLTEMDILSSDLSVWETIATAIGPTSDTGTVAGEYAVLRLIITAQGTGYVLNAWVRWD